MKILLIYSGNAKNFSFEKNQAFIFDQIKSCNQNFPELTYFHFVITSKGILGYLKNFFHLIWVLLYRRPDVVHAHYGLSGFVASLTLFKPLVITFHGSDINIPSNKRFSSVAAKFASYSIYVSEKLKEISGNKRDETKVIPCGVDLDTFTYKDKFLTRNNLGMDYDKVYVLFSSAFDNEVKNYSLAKEAISLTDKEIIILELKNKTRSQVCELLNASDLLLLTSFSEGSPQVIKEAMACNCPIVTTNVGDVKEVIGDTIGCFVTGFDATEIAKSINQVIEFGKRTNGREKIANFDNNFIASRIIKIYYSVLKKQKQ